MEGDHPPALLTDVLGEDDDRRALSPQVRLRLIAAVGILCLLALVMAVADLVKDQRAQQRRKAVAARDARSATMMLTASCDAVARLQAPSSVQIRARHPGRRAVVVRVPFDGAALLDRPRADCALALGPLGG